MNMLETSAKSGENVLNASEKLIHIVHNKALEASSKNKGGINISGGVALTIKLDDNQNVKSEDVSACGC